MQHAAYSLLPAKTVRFARNSPFYLALVMASVLSSCQSAKLPPNSGSLKAVAEAQPLVFPSTGNSESASPAERSDTLGMGRAKEILSTTANYDSAWTLFNRYRAAALEMDGILDWFSLFSRSGRLLVSEAARTKLTGEWVKEALESEDPRLRSAITQALRELGWGEPSSFYLRQSKLRPGEFLSVDGYDYGAEKRKGIQLRLEKARLDSNLHPRGFVRVVDTTLLSTEEMRRRTGYAWNFRHRLDSMGIYRLVMHGPHYFEEQYFQVSHLDMTVKTDGSKLLVWGSSFQNKWPAPYDVYVWNKQSQQVRFRTDDLGLAVFSLRDSVHPVTGDLRVAIRSGNNLAFTHAGIPGLGRDVNRVGAIYTDRPAYRPGHTIHFRGLIHGQDNRQRLFKGALDSIQVRIKDPEYQDFYERVVPVDAWGHFGDSIVLGKEARLGNYRFDMYYAYRKGKEEVVSMRGGSFLVEAYKKPEFEVAVTAGKPHVLLGDTVRMRATGRYFFGRPLAGVPIRVRWYRSDMSPYFSSYGGKGRVEFWASGNKNFIRQDSLNLNAQGEIDIAYLPDWTEPYSYLIAEVSAVDASRREVRAEAKVRVAKYRTYLNIQFDKYQYRQRDTVRAEILATDLDGNPLPGELSLRVKKDKAVIQDERRSLPADGRLSWRYLASEVGSYLLEATLTGPDPKPVYQEAEFQVVAAEEQTWDWERIEFRTDKESYRPGDTARITLDVGADEVPALLTAEGNALLDYRVHRIGDRKLAYQMILDSNFGQNVHVGVAYSGKTGMALGSHVLKVVDSSALLKAEWIGPRIVQPGSQYQGSLRIRDARGNPIQARFSVAVVDEAVFAVAAKKSQGRNHSWRYSGWWGEDEGDLGLLELFRGYNPNVVYSEVDRITANDIWNLHQARFQEAYANSPAPAMAPRMAAPALLAMEQSAPAKSKARAEDKVVLAKMAFDASGDEDALKKVGGAGPGEPPPPPPPRERNTFRDVAYWLPMMETDAQGKGEIAFTLPDDLTRWRLLLRGSDGASHLLDFKDSLVTRQDVMVKLEGPRTLVVGDTIHAASVLHNYSGKTLQAQVRFSVASKGGEVRLIKKGDSTVTLEPNATLRIDWPLHAVRSGDVEFATSVQSGKEGDAERRTYPVRERGLPEVQSVAGQWQGGEALKTHVIRYPDSAKATSRRLELVFAPSLAWSMFQSLDYLTGFPYGCVEQTMSRFLPNLYVASALKTMGRRDDSLFANLPKYTSAGLERLAALRHANGGWGWWQGGDDEPHMTALVVFGLEFALTQDLPEDLKSRARQLLQPGREALKQMLKGMKPSDDYAYALHALSQSGNPTDMTDETVFVRSRLKTLVANRGKLSAYGLALLLESLHRRGLEAEKAKIVELLATMKVETGAELSWPGREDFGWYSQDVETTAQVLRAITLIDSRHAWIPKIIPYLSRKKNGGYWVSTKTTAAVIYALVPYIQQSRELNPDYALTVLLNGKSLLQKKLSQADLSSGPIRLTVVSESLASVNTLEIRAEGKGKLYYQVDSRWVVESDSMAAKDNGIRVRRSYTKLQYGQNPKGVWEVKRVPLVGDLKSGDEVEVSLTLKARSAYENLILEDFFPTGMEVVKKPEEFIRAWCGWWFRGYDHEEARDDRMVYFLDRVYEGERTFSYILRAETPGTFIALPAKSELMYYPDVNGHSASQRFRIVD